MASRSLGYVFRREDRWRVDLPAALTGVFGATFALGLAPAGRKRIPWLVWGSLVGAAASGTVCALAHGALQWDVAVDQWGVRLVSRAGQRIDIGVPSSVRQGRQDAMSLGGAVSGLFTRCWVAVETDAGRIVLFESLVGGGSPGFAEWPEEAPPETDDRFSSLRFDLAAFRAALWSAMLR